MTPPASVPTDADRPAPPSFVEALVYWLKLGFISFGGPAGQIALMHQELVERRRWISESRFLHALNYCMVLPGPEAQQLATYIGWLIHRTWGGLAAGGLFVLPSLAILIALSWVYMAYGDVPAIAALLYGVKPAVIAIVAFAAYRIGGRTLRNRWLWAIAIAAFAGMFVWRLPFPLIIVAAGAVGVVGSRFAPAAFSIAGGHVAAASSSGPAWLDDATPTPPHARFSWRRSIRVGAVCLGLWAAALAMLAAAFGWNAVLTQMALFFTQAALLTFGGAYAVLPYVFQGAVEGHHWLSAAQMIDGLALGETTPGPLIMVVSFVGFVGAWSAEVLGPGTAFASGAAGALVVTFFTFLPSFFFIFVGAPFIESTHGDLRFSAPLTAITAAVVGVIVNLAVFFAAHVLWPHGTSAGTFDGAAAAIGGVALLALVRFRVGVIPVIAGSALLGLVLRLA